MTSEYIVKRVICIIWTDLSAGIFANSADPDQTPRSQGLHCLLKLQEVKG